MATFSRRTFDGSRKKIPGRDRRLRTDEIIERITAIRHAEGARDRTLADYEKFFGNFQEFVNLPEYADELVAEDFREYINVLLKRGLEPSTVNIRMNALRAIMNRLFTEGLLGKTNPVEGVKKLKTDDTRIYSLNDNQLRRLFSVIDVEKFTGYRDYCAMLLMLKSGLRINEINSVEESDFNFNQRIIALPGAKNKNRKNRMVPFNEKVSREIQTLLGEQKYYFEEYERENGKVTNVFRNTDGSPISENSIRRNMYRYGVKAGLKGECKFSPHALRHTFAVNFMRLGGDVRALMEILGHTSLETTSHYLKYSETMLIDRYNIVDEKDNFDI